MESALLGFVRVDELKAAAAAGRLSEVIEGSLLRLIGTGSVYGFRSAILSRSGSTIPEELSEALESKLTQRMCSDALNGFSLSIGPDRIVEHGAALGNWVHVRNYHGRAVALGITVGAITCLSWKGPGLRLLGIDTSKSQCVYEYFGEVSTY